MSLTVDDVVLDRRAVAPLSVSNRQPLTIGGKLKCDQVTITCDYFSGDIDAVRIEVGSAQPRPTGAVVFEDGFDDGFTRWARVTGMTIDDTLGSPAPPSARLSVVEAVAWAEAFLPATTDSPCVSVDVSVTDASAAVLFRLRTESGEPIVRVRLDDGGFLRVRSDVSGASSPRAALLGSGWHRIALCGSIGPAGSWALYRDGVSVLAGWVADTGTLPAGRVWIGDKALRTWTANFDRVIVEDLG
ncbi:hypothetical protein HRbin12_01335 [bacterium HR12]|nr:hypothetical protein HRbin12_01335 [bacterium HR12]